MTLEFLSGLDWIVMTDMKDAEVTGEMVVLNVAEMLTEEDRQAFFLLAGNMDDDLEEDEEPREDEETEAFLFKVCPEEEAEFRVCSAEKGAEPFYVTTELTEKEYSQAAELFMETTADFDIEIEE